MCNFQFIFASEEGSTKATKSSTFCDVFLDSFDSPIEDSSLCSVICIFNVKVWFMSALLRLEQLVSLLSSCFSFLVQILNLYCFVIGGKTRGSHSQTEDREVVPARSATESRRKCTLKCACVLFRFYRPFGLCSCVLQFVCFRPFVVVVVVGILVVFTLLRCCFYDVVIDV